MGLSKSQGGPWVGWPWRFCALWGLWARLVGFHSVTEGARGVKDSRGNWRLGFADVTICISLVMSVSVCVRSWVRESLQILLWSIIFYLRVFNLVDGVVVGEVWLVALFLVIKNDLWVVWINWALFCTYRVVLHWILPLFEKFTWFVSLYNISSCIDFWIAFVQEPSSLRGTSPRESQLWNLTFFFQQIPMTIDILRWPLWWKFHGWMLDVLNFAPHDPWLLAKNWHILSRLHLWMLGLLLI